MFKRSERAWKPKRGLRFALRRSAALWWAATIVLALVTANVAGSAMRTARGAADAWGTSREVWVVQRPLDPGDVIGRVDVQKSQVPAALVPDGALDGASSPVGEATRVGLSTGEVVLVARLAGRGAHGVAAMVEPGHRGVAIPYDDQMPRVRVGDRVDLLATFDVEDPAAEPSFAIAANVAVLAVTARALTVAVPTENAARVAFALTKGAVTVALRGGVSEPRIPRE